MTYADSKVTFFETLTKFKNQAKVKVLRFLVTFKDLLVTTHVNHFLFLCLSFTIINLEGDWTTSEPEEKDQTDDVPKGLNQTLHIYLLLILSLCEIGLNHQYKEHYRDVSPSEGRIRI